MQVYIVNQFALRPGDKGSLRHFYLGRYLLGRGIGVEVLTSNVTYNSRDPLVWKDKEETHEGVLFKCFEAPQFFNNIQRLYNHLIFSLKIFVYLIRRLNRNDAVVGSTPQPFSAYAAYIAARLKGARFIYEVRDLWPQTLIDLGGLSKKHPMVLIMKFIERTLAVRGDRTVTLMPLAWKYFEEEYSLPRDAVVCIPQGIEIPNTDVPLEYPDTGKFEIMYAGTLGLANRTEMIIEVAKYLKVHSNIVFNVYGDGPLKSWMMAEADKHSLTNINFLGMVPRKVVVEELGKTHAALALAHESPLYKYGISYNKLTDYFLSKKPVIFIGNVSMNPVSVGNAGLVTTSNDPVVVAKEILDFANKPKDELRNMGENGYRYLLENHDINITGAKLYDILVRAGLP